MSYKIIISEEVKTQLKKLDNPTAKRILEKIVGACENPKHFFKRLTGREEYKLRIGDWRVIAKIIYKEKTIFVVSIGHRKKIYK